MRVFGSERGKDMLDENDIILKSVENLGTTPFIYFLISNNEIVYVGQSLGKLGIGRIWQHKDKHFDRYTILECDENNLSNKEADYILKFLPKYNKAFPVCDKYVGLGTLRKRYGDNLSNFKLQKIGLKKLHFGHYDVYEIDEVLKHETEIKNISHDYKKTEFVSGSVESGYAGKYTGYFKDGTHVSDYLYRKG
jgi:hypothetical protein